MLKLAVDIGGTFTDVVAETAQGLSSIKLLTNPSAPEIAALTGISELLDRLSYGYEDVDCIVHGTTLATNALIERRGAKTALVTTAGFRDVLEMRNEKRFDQYDLNIRMPQPLVPRPLRFGVRERVLADGSVMTRPDDVQIDGVAQLLVEQDVEAVAIGFLHSYRNNEHEQYVANRLRATLGEQVTICQSAQVAGEIREFERFSTVCANAYVRPLMARYLARLESELATRGFGGAFLMMLSDGALTTTELARCFPIRLVEGGPAGGVALGAHVARETHSRKTLSMDIGGTTAKICFIKNGTPQTSRCFEVARAWRDIRGSGLPVRVPTVELVEIGAGGGSIATVDTLGRLKAGPRSAGSEPGPASYDRGGEEPTVTDAHVVVGGIAAEGFADGMIALDPQRAVNALANQVQIKLEFDTVEEAAAGVIELANETMANAARVHGIELGLDVSSFDLLVSGGGGGLHAARIAEKLGIRRIIVPALAGVGSAVGFLRSPIAFETALSVIQPIESIDHADLENRLHEASNYVRQVVASAVESDRISVSFMAEMRYCGQGLEFRIPLSVEGDFETELASAQDSFIARYEAHYGFVLSQIEVELVSLIVNARENTLDVHATAQPAHAPPEADVAIGEFRRAERLSTRDVYDHAAREFKRVAVVPRTTLKNEVLSGPVVIGEAQTTTLVPKFWSVKKSQQGHLIMEKHP